MGIVAARREQVDQQYVHAHVERIHDLAGEAVNVHAPVLVGRESDLEQGNESMAADVANGQTSPARQGCRLDGFRRCTRGGASATAVPPVSGGNGAADVAAGLACRVSTSVIGRPACCSARA
jgi:hypothetical protein